MHVSTRYTEDTRLTHNLLQSVSLQCKIHNYTEPTANCMEQIRSEANGSSAFHENSHILWNLKVHCRVDRRAIAFPTCVHCLITSATLRTAWVG
jgi:hypothetical protein